jgi:hypothetical protein
MMKKLNFFIFSMFIFVIFCVSFTGNAISQESESLEVAEGAICLDVIDLECTGADTNFPANVGKLYCITKITGAKGASQVTHVWYYGQTERARIVLDVRSKSWRTYSSKIIQSHETGDWHIDVLGPKDEFLKVIQFEIGP